MTWQPILSINTQTGWKPVLPTASLPAPSFNIAGSTPTTTTTSVDPFSAIDTVYGAASSLPGRAVGYGLSKLPASPSFNPQAGALAAKAPVQPFSQQAQDAVATSNIPGAKHIAPIVGVAAGFMEPLPGGPELDAISKVGKTFYGHIIQDALKTGKTINLDADALKLSMGIKDTANHVPFAQEAQHAYQTALKVSKSPNVFITVGGPATAKSEVLAHSLADEGGILLQGTGANYDRTVAHFNDALKAGKKPVIVSNVVTPEDAWTFAQARQETGGHTTSLEYFISRSKQATDTLKRLITEGYPVMMKDARGLSSIEEARNAPFIRNPKTQLELLDTLRYDDVHVHPNSRTPTAPAETSGIPHDTSEVRGSVAEVAGGNRPAQSLEQLAETAGGWRAGDKVKFDRALLRKDAATIQDMLPRVPQEYQQRFATDIQKILQPSKTGETAVPLEQVYKEATQYPSADNFAFIANRKYGISSKQATDIWKKATGIPEELQPLTEEARKYKSAEEFVKAQGMPVYHGTDNNFTSFDINKSGQNTPFGTKTKIITVTPDKPLAQHYGKNVVEAFIDPARVKLYDKLPLGGPQLDMRIAEAQKEGYAAISAKQSLSGASDLENGVPVTFVFDSNALKTKSQLTDLYNKATGKGGLPKAEGKTALPSKAPSLPEPLQAGKEGQLPQKVSSFPDTTINTKNFNISQVGKDTIDRVVAEVKPAIEKVVGKKLGNDEAIKLADQSSKILSRAVPRDHTLAWQASLLKARQALAAASESGTVDEAYIKNLLTIKTQGTDIARKLQSFSIGADAIEPTAKQAILEAVLKVNKNTDEILKAAKGVDFTNFKQATDFYRKFIKPTAGEWLDLIRYNSMLSSPKTHIINTVSNFLNTGVIAPFEKTLTGGLDFLGSKITGSQRSAFAGEGIQYAKGALASTRNATFRFADVMRGNRTYTNLDTRNIPIASSGAKGAVVSTLSFPMRLLEGMDQFFTALAEGGQTSALKYRASKGVKVGNIESAAQRDARYRLYRQKPLAEQEGHLLNAVDQFTVMIKKLRNNKNPIVSTVSKFTVPFLQTPMNIFKQGLEYSPIGFGTLPGAANKTEQLSKALIGSSIFAGAATLLVSNRLTWGEPTSPADKAAFRGANMQAYSVKIGDKWYSYQKLPPGVAFPLAIVAAIHDTQANKKIDDNTVDLVLSSVAKYGQFLADQSYAKSIGDLLSTAKGGESGIEKVVSNYAQQLVPYRALGGWLARLTDNTQRKVDSQAGFIDQQVQLLMLNFPGLSQKVPARLDNQGNPIPQPFPAINAFSPAAISQQSPAQEKQYQDYSAIKGFSQHASQESANLTQDAQQTWSELKTLPKEEAKAQLKQLAQTNPDLATKVINIAKSTSKTASLTATEQKLLSSPIESRAQFIAAEIKNYASKEDYKAYLKDLAAKKILTADTLTRLTELLKNFTK